jgi:hypothetical protein
MTVKDFMPQSWSAFGEWMANFVTHFNVLGAKYGLASEFAQLEKDNLWVQYWLQAKVNAKAQEKQLTDFIDGIVNGEQGAPSPTDPVWTLPPNPPANIATGLKKKLRSLARQIKANPLYTKADGEVLGIVSPDEAGLSPEDTAPEFTLRSMPNYAVEIDFRKYGTDALRVEFRHKGGNWILAAILTSSPGIFNIVPSNAGEAEQIEARGIFLIKNQPFGNYSPTYNVVIQP